MATDPYPDPTPADSSSYDTSELWRAIGRLEGTAAALLEGQRELRTDLDNGLREVNRRIDRLFYAILGIGGALVAAVLASRFIQ